MQIRGRSASEPRDGDFVEAVAITILRTLEDQTCYRGQATWPGQAVAHLTMAQWLPE